MVAQDIINYVQEAIAIEIVRMVRKGGGEINFKNSIEDEIISFVYDQYVHDSTWGKMLMDEKVRSTEEASEAEAVIQKVAYMLAIKWVVNKAGIGRQISINTAIDITAGLFLKDFALNKTSVGGN